jgi:DNA-binding transcriptional ArsR family regulator
MIEPFWPVIRSVVAGDHLARTAELADGGVDSLLSNLHPHVRWRRPVLEVQRFHDAEVHLDGRGLLLQPAYFCGAEPTKLRDPELAPILVFPVPHTPGELIPVEDAGSVGESLCALLGRTRASALAATVTACTTSQLGRRCGISVATASHQASVLRDAGLITSTRDGGSVVHQITDLGAALLGGRPVGDRPTDGLNGSAA